MGAERIIELLEIQNEILGKLSGTLDKYAPALDRAAALVDSPAAKLASRISRPRGRAGNVSRGKM